MAMCMKRPARTVPIESGPVKGAVSTQSSPAKGAVSTQSGPIKGAVSTQSDPVKEQFQPSLALPVDASWDEECQIWPTIIIGN